MLEHSEYNCTEIGQFLGFHLIHILVKYLRNTRG